MCEYCETKTSKGMVCGNPIPYKETAAGNIGLTDAQILYNSKTESPAIVSFIGCVGSYIYIHYCPMCGRKLD